jgi:hypothetical protein
MTKLEKLFKQLAWTDCPSDFDLDCPMYVLSADQVGGFGSQCKFGDALNNKECIECFKKATTEESDEQ